MKCLIKDYRKCYPVVQGGPQSGFLELAAGPLSEEFVLLRSFAFFQMNVAAAFIFLIQEVVIPFIILSCFLFKTFFFFSSWACTFPLSRRSSILCACSLKPFVH